MCITTKDVKGLNSALKCAKAKNLTSDYMVLGRLRKVKVR